MLLGDFSKCASGKEFIAVKNLLVGAGFAETLTIEI
jgi:hypothetical protein